MAFFCCTGATISITITEIAAPHSMETLALIIAACLLSGIAGYAIAHEAQASRLAHARAALARYAEQLAALRKATACACGLPARHTGKHAPRAFYSESPAMRELARSLSAQPKITRSRVPTQPKKKSTKKNEKYVPPFPHGKI